MKPEVKQINKTCSCGKKYFKLPENAKEWFDEDLLIGWTWVCQECKSNPFVKVQDVEAA